jgi:hypothetical protein
MNIALNEINKLPNLDDHIAQKEREEFLIVQAKIIKETGKTIEISIGDNPATASTIAERRTISDPKPENGGKEDIRFPAGGLGIIVKTPGQNHLIAVLRASKSSFDRHLTTFSGLGCISEITDPERTAIRKGLEDLIIIAKNKIIIPQFKNDIFSRIDIKAIIRDGATLYKETGGLSSEKAPAHLIELANEKKFKITWRGNEYIYRGLPAHDPGTRGLDFIKIMAVEFDEKLEDLTFLDGRIIGGRNPLNRDIYALELDGNFKWTGRISAGWQWNKTANKYEYFIPKEKIKFPQTPILKTIITELARPRQ